MELKGRLAEIQQNDRQDNLPKMHNGLLLRREENRLKAHTGNFQAIKNTPFLMLQRAPVCPSPVPFSLLSFTYLYILYTGKYNSTSLTDKGERQMWW